MLATDASIHVIDNSGSENDGRPFVSPKVKKKGVCKPVSTVVANKQTINAKLVTNPMKNPLSAIWNARDGDIGSSNKLFNYFLGTDTSNLSFDLDKKYFDASEVDAVAFRDDNRYPIAHEDMLEVKESYLPSDPSLILRRSLNGYTVGSANFAAQFRYNLADNDSWQVFHNNFLYWRRYSNTALFGMAMEIDVVDDNDTDSSNWDGNHSQLSSDVEHLMYAFDMNAEIDAVHDVSADVNAKDKFNFPAAREEDDEIEPIDIPASSEYMYNTGEIKNFSNAPSHWKFRPTKRKRAPTADEKNNNKKRGSTRGPGRRRQKKIVQPFLDICVNEDGWFDELSRHFGHDDVLVPIDGIKRKRRNWRADQSKWSRKKLMMMPVRGDDHFELDFMEYTKVFSWDTSRAFARAHEAVKLMFEKKMRDLFTLHISDVNHQMFSQPQILQI